MTNRSPVIAASMLAISMIVSAAPAVAYQCKGYPHQAVGVRMAQSIAKFAARQNWQSSARSMYGNSWALWKLAKAKNISCVRLNSGQWRCLTSARPCNFVVP